MVIVKEKVASEPNLYLELKCSLIGEKKAPNKRQHRSSESLIYPIITTSLT